MELIYELKGNMEQLHQEVAEIRRSLKTCVNMQMELQQSIRQEIMAALCQPGMYVCGGGKNMILFSNQLVFLLQEIFYDVNK